MAEQKLLTVVYKAIDEVNQMLPDARKVAKAPDAPLREPAGSLDSLGLVNLIVALEENIEIDYGITLNLADQRSVDESADPLASVDRLVAYLERLVD